MQSLLATGRIPRNPTTGDVDFTPLLYAATHAPRMVPGPRSVQDLGDAGGDSRSFAGGLIDSISDGLGPSIVTNACVLALVALLIPSMER